jgi:hypothetical protein
MFARKRGNLAFSHARIAALIARIFKEGSHIRTNTFIEEPLNLGFGIS